MFAPDTAYRSAGGARITYWLKQPAKTLTLEILDANGQIVRTYTGAMPGQGRGGGGAGREGGAEAAPGEGRQGGRGQEGGRGGRGSGGGAPSMAAGINSFTWDLQYPGPTTFPGMVLWGATTAGPAVLPGTYQVKLTVDGRSTTQPLTVKKHPLRPVSDADLKEQFDLAMQIREKVSEANNAVIKIREIKQQVAERVAKSNDAALKAAADRLTKNLSAVEEAIYQVRNQSGQDPLNFPIKINNRLAGILRVVNVGDGKPVAGVYDILQKSSADLKVQTDRLQQVLATDLPAFETEAKRTGVQ